MIKYYKVIGLICCLGLTVLVGCSKEEKDEVLTPGPDPAGYDRQSMLSNYVEGYIKPAYSEYEAQVIELDAEVASFNSVLTLTALQSLRMKWENALLVWQDVAFLEFGPAANISLRSQTNIYPVKTDLIKNNISTGSYNLEAGSNFSAKGFQALDYLLYGVGSSDDEVVSYFTNTLNARNYLKDVTSELRANATTVKAEWFGSYATSFVDNSASNAEGSSISDIINAINLHYEAFMRKGKIGLPLGVFNQFSSKTLPTHVEAFNSNKSLPYIYRSLNSLKTFVNGDNYSSNASGEGLDDYMSFVNATTANQSLRDIINNQFSAIQSELGSINDPLSNEVDVNTSGVNKLYQEMQKMVRYLKVDMSDALEVLITYQDSDGD